MVRKRVTPAKPPEEQFVTPEFRAKSHALMDRVLTEHPGTTAIMICVAKGKDVDAASEPNALALKLGMIDMLYFTLHPERITDE